MQTSSRITLNTVTSWVNLLINGAIGVVLVPFLLWQFGKDAYGLVVLAGVVVSVTMILDMGLRAALSRHLAAAEAKNDDARFNELASTALFLYLSLGVFATAVCATFAPWITSAFNLPSNLFDQGVFLVRWYTGPAVILTFLSVPFEGILTSQNRFDLVNMTILVGGLVKALLLFSILLLTDWGIYGWALGMLASRASIVLVDRILAKRIKPDAHIRLRSAHRSAVRSLFSTGGYVSVAQIVSLLSVYSDPIVLTNILGPAAVAIYTPAVMLVGMARSLVNGLASQLHPLATSYHVTGQQERLHQLLVRGTCYTMLMGLLACVVFGAFAQPICRIWLAKSLGHDYLITALVLLIWAGIELSNYAAGSQWPVLLGMNRLRFILWSQVPFAIINLTASILLVKFTSLGVIGVALPTLVIGFIRRPILIIYTAIVVKLPVRRYLVDGYVRPLAVLAIAGAFAFGLDLTLRPQGIGVLLVCVAATCLVWVPAVWWVGFGSYDRASFRSLIKRGLSFATKAGRDDEGGESLSDGERSIEMDSHADEGGQE